MNIKIKELPSRKVLRAASGLKPRAAVVVMGTGSALADGLAFVTDTDFLMGFPTFIKQQRKEKRKKIQYKRRRKKRKGNRPERQ